MLRSLEFSEEAAMPMIDVIAGDPGLAARTWVLVCESPDAGWGICGHAFTNAEIAETARRDLGSTR
jgi:hypothetical protein